MYGGSDSGSASSEGKSVDRDKFTAPASAGAGATSGADKFAVFEQWLLDNGSKFPKLELRDYGDEVRGCHAQEVIGEEEIIIEIPLKCLITVEMGKDTDIGRAILSSNVELDAPKHIFLMVFMLLDRKNEASFFKPYYDILPPTLSNMPIFWTAEELGYLEGSYLLTQIQERNAAIEADYGAICKVAPEFVHVSTLDDFKWARMCACSRNFGLIVNGLRTAALVPYADMLNHYRPRETKWQFDDTLQGFTITSLQRISPGAQVYDSYGQKCNHRFLLNYGFSVEFNVEPDGFCPNEVRPLRACVVSCLSRSSPTHLSSHHLTFSFHPPYYRHPSFCSSSAGTPCTTTSAPTGAATARCLPSACACAWRTTTTRASCSRCCASSRPTKWTWTCSWAQRAAATTAASATRKRPLVCATSSRPWRCCAACATSTCRPTRHPTRLIVP